MVTLSLLLIPIKTISLTKMAAAGQEVTAVRAQENIIVLEGRKKLTDHQVNDGKGDFT